MLAISKCEALRAGFRTIFAPILPSLTERSSEYGYPRKGSAMLYRMHCSCPSIFQRNCVRNGARRLPRSVNGDDERFGSRGPKRRAFTSSAECNRTDDEDFPVNKLPVKDKKHRIWKLVNSVVAVVIYLDNFIAVHVTIAVTSSSDKPKTLESFLQPTSVERATSVQTEQVHATSTILHHIRTQPAYIAK